VNYHSKQEEWLDHMISISFLTMLMLSTFITGIQPTTVSGCQGCPYHSDDYIITDLVGAQLIDAINLAISSPVAIEAADHLTRRGYTANFNYAIAQSHSWEEGTRQVLLVTIPFGNDAAIAYALGICGKESAIAYIVKEYEKVKTIEIFSIRPDGVRSWQIIKRVTMEDLTFTYVTYMDSLGEVWYGSKHLVFSIDEIYEKTLISHINTTIIETWRIKTRIQYEDEHANVHTLSQYSNSYGDSETIETDIIGIRGNGGGGGEIPCTGDPPSCPYRYAPVCICTQWDFGCMFIATAPWAFLLLDCFLCAYLLDPLSCISCFAHIFLEYGFDEGFEQCCIGGWQWVCWLVYRE
jgi:hypothetical protein